MQGFGGTNLLYNEGLLNFAMEGQELGFAPSTDPLGGGDPRMCNANSEFMGLVQNPFEGPSDLHPDLHIPSFLETDPSLVAGPSGSTLPDHNMHNGSVLDGSLLRSKENARDELLVLHGGGGQPLPPCTCSHLRWSEGEGENNNPFEFEESLALQDVLPHPQITNPCPRCCNNIDSLFVDQQPSPTLVGARGGVGTVGTSVTGAPGEKTFDGSDAGPGSGFVRSTCAVTMQWEESLQDLQSLLALQGHQSQVMDPRALPMQIEPAGGAFDRSGSNFRASGSYPALETDRTGTSGGAVGGFSFGQIPAVDAIGETEMMNLIQFSRTSPSLPSTPAQRTPFQAPAGPVSAFPSNPGFRRGAQLNPSSPNSPSPTGLYPAPDPPPFLYPPPPNFNNINPPGPGFSNFVNQVNSPGLQLQKQPQPPFLMRPPSLSDLEQSRDRRVGESSSGRGASILSMGSGAGNARFPSPLFEPGGRRGGGEGGLLSGKPGAEPRGINHFATERQRREFLNEKYQTLRSLVPNPSKADRASIVADAIEYVKDLKRSVQDLNILVLEKRRGPSVKEGAAHQAANTNKRRRDADGNGNAASEETAGPSRDLAIVSNDRSGSSLEASNSQLGTVTSWQQRTSQSTGTQVDVRIVHDDVTIKLVKRKRPGCQALLQILVALLELHLDLQNANGATIDDHDVYCFNTKMSEGSLTFAGFVITKLLEAVDRD